MLDPTLPEEEEPAWQTGTAVDEFNPIYLALARATQQHGAFPPAEVDRMDITTVALLMGVGVDVEAAEMAQLAEMAKRRRLGEDVSWDTLGG